MFRPTSNLLLGSGLYDHQGLREKGNASGIATDDGAAPSYSMLLTLNEIYLVQQLRRHALHPLQAFHRATNGKARVLRRIEGSL